MLSSIDIEGLRGIQTGQLSGMTQLAAISGPNSAGKSSILDAIFLGASPDPSQGLHKLMSRRCGLRKPGDWLLWRRGTDEATKARIVLKTSERTERIIEVSRSAASPDTPLTVMSEQPRKRGGAVFKFTDQPDGPLDGVPEVRLVDAEGTAETTPLYALYTRAVERGMRREVKLLLKELIPDLEDVEILTQGDEPVVYLVYEHGAQPISLAGDGIRHLLYQSLQLAALPGSIALLEEPEVHMHPAAIRQIARAMWAAVGRGIQIILTTHSLDMIDSLIAAANTMDLDKLSFFRVQLEQGVLKSHRLSGSEASLARTQIEDDLR